MKLEFKAQYKYSAPTLMRKCGYGKAVSPKNGEVSFTRRLCVGMYPRFHIYLKFEEKGFLVNLHLDQKKASYAGYKAHSGEYEGVVVRHEGERIKLIISDYKI